MLDEAGLCGLTMPVTLQKSPFGLPVAAAGTIAAVCTIAPPLSSPIAAAGIAKPCRPAQFSGVMRATISAANTGAGATPAHAIVSSTPAIRVQKSCLIVLVLDRTVT